MESDGFEIGRRHLQKTLTEFYRPRTAAQPARSAPIDPVQVGKEAREYQDAQAKEGKEISTTDAVAAVMAQQGAQ